MTKGPVKRLSIREIKAQLDLLTVKLKDYECDAGRCKAMDCTFVSDGLRLSQEVELLKKDNIELRKKNEALRKRLATGSVDNMATCE